MLTIYLSAPGILYQCLFLLALVVLGFTAPTRTISGLARLAYAEIRSAVEPLTQKILPAWLSRGIILAILFPVTSVWLLSALAVWNLVTKYRRGVHEITEKTGKSVQRALLAADNANAHTRGATALEVQAMQITAAADDSDSEFKYIINSAKHLVQQMVADLPLVYHRVEKVKELADKARLLAEEGDFELAALVAVNTEKAVEQVIEAEQKLSEKSEITRKRLWHLTGRETSVRRVEAV